jgi:hypothetical protein
MFSPCSMQQGKMFFVMGIIMATVQGKTVWIFVDFRLILSKKVIYILSFSGGYVRRIAPGGEKKLALQVRLSHPKHFSEFLTQMQVPRKKESTKSSFTGNDCSHTCNAAVGICFVN